MQDLFDTWILRRKLKLLPRPTIARYVHATDDEISESRNDDNATTRHASCETVQTSASAAKSQNSDVNCSNDSYNCKKENSDVIATNKKTVCNENAKTDLTREKIEIDLTIRSLTSFLTLYSPI